MPAYHSRYRDNHIILIHSLMDSIVFDIILPNSIFLLITFWSTPHNKVQIDQICILTSLFCFVSMTMFFNQSTFESQIYVCTSIKIIKVLTITIKVYFTKRYVLCRNNCHNERQQTVQLEWIIYLWILNQ
jgi:hypothetical protein